MNWGEPLGGVSHLFVLHAVSRNTPVCGFIYPNGALRDAFCTPQRLSCDQSSQDSKVGGSRDHGTKRFFLIAPENIKNSETVCRAGGVILIHFAYNYYSRRS